MFSPNNYSVAPAVPSAQAVHGGLCRGPGATAATQTQSYVALNLRGVKRCRCLTSLRTERCVEGFVCTVLCAAREKPNVDILFLAPVASLFCTVAAELLCCVLLTVTRHECGRSPHLHTCRQATAGSLLKLKTLSVNVSHPTGSFELISSRSRYGHLQPMKLDMFDKLNQASDILSVPVRGAGPVKDLASLVRPDAR